MQPPKWRDGYGVSTGPNRYKKDHPKVLAKKRDRLTQTDSLKLLDESDPDSLINIAPDEMVEVIKATFKKYPKFFNYSERLLRSECEVDERDERFRLLFWDEYNCATALKRRMYLKHVTTSFTSNAIWYNFYAQRLDKMRFILYPPQNYNYSLRSILDKGLSKLNEIMNLPVLLPNGQADVKAITQIIKVFQLVDTRIKGAIVQKVQIQQQSLNINADAGQVSTEQLAAMSLEQLTAMEKKLDKIEKAEKRMLNALPPDEKQEVLDVIAEIERDPRDYNVKDISSYPEDKEVLE